MKNELVGVVLAGGVGSRLYPLSTETNPKPFIELGEMDPLIVSAVRRLKLAGVELVIAMIRSSQLDVWTRTARRYADVLGDVLVVLEPEGRGTFAPALFSASYALGRFEDPVLVVTPADHFIAPEDLFANQLQIAAKSAASADGVVLFGIRPDKPETGFGYIEVADEAEFSSRTNEVLPVVSFREKPDAETAQEYVLSGRHFFNSGIFVFRAGWLANWTRLSLGISLVPMFEQDGLLLWPSPAEYATLPKGAFDRIVLERTGGHKMLEAGFSWSDLGTFESIIDLLGGAHRLASIGEVVFVDSHDCFAANLSKKPLAVFGASNVAIVALEDFVHVKNL